MAANITATRQKEYVNSMSALLSTFEGGHMRKFGERKDAIVGEEIVFYKSSGGSSTRNTRNMLDPAYVGQGGKIDAITLVPEYLLWDEKIPQMELWKTKLDVKSELVRLGINQLKVDEDKLILSKIMASSSLTPAGSATKDLNVLLRTLVGKINASIMKSKMTLDKIKGTAMIMNETAYEIFTSSNASLKTTFVTNQEGLGKGNVPSSILGCDIVTFPDAIFPSGTILLIPYGTFGSGSWKGSEKSSAEYKHEDLKFWLTADITAGACVLDAAAITKFSYLPSSKPSEDLIV